MDIWSTKEQCCFQVLEMDEELRKTNFFVFFLSNPAVPAPSLAQWYFPGSLFSLVFAVLFEMSDPL